MFPNDPIEKFDTLIVKELLPQYVNIIIQNLL